MYPIKIGFRSNTSVTTEISNFYFEKGFLWLITEDGVRALFNKNEIVYIYLGEVLNVSE